MKARIARKILRDTLKVCKYSKQQENLAARLFVHKGRSQVYKGPHSKFRNNRFLKYSDDYLTAGILLRNVYFCNKINDLQEFFNRIKKYGEDECQIK